MGLFDAAAGIFQGVGSFLGTTFSAIGERFQGGTLTAGSAAGAGTRAGATFGNLLADIAPSVLTALGTGALAPERPAGTPAARPRFGTAAFELRLPPTRVGGPAATASFGALDLFGGLTDPVTIEALTQNVLGLPTALGRLGTQIFGGDDMPFHTAPTALPGGAAFPSPVPAQGRIFTPHQNLVTGAVTLRTAREVQFMNPQTGKIVTFLNAGRCLLWSGDVAAAKRVQRIAARAKRRSPR